MMIETIELETIPQELVEYEAQQSSLLPEFKFYQPKSGHPDWKKLEQEAKEIAAQLLPTLEPPQKPWAKMRRQMVSYKTAASNFVTNWRLTRAGREDLRPLFLLWTVTRSCNFLCTYCDDHQGSRYPELPKEGVLNTSQAIKLLEIMRTRTPAIYFAGGEPTIRPDLPIVTRKARDLGYHPIIINTNASMVEKNLRKNEWATWLADTDIVIVSLDALNLRKLSKMWVTKKPQDVIRNLLILRELSGPMDFKLMVNCVIQPDTIDEAKSVLDFVNDLGIWLCPVPMNMGERILEGLGSDPKYQKLTDLILERKKQGYRITGSYRLNRRLLKSEKLVCRNTLKPHVDYDGRLVWPCKACVNVKPEYVDVLKYKNVDDLYDAASTLISPTGFHGPAKNQCGGDCNWAQNYSTDSYANGLRNPLSLLGEIYEFVVSR